MEEHKIMVICQLVSELATPSNGAEKDVCEKCLSEVWISEKSRGRKKALDAKVFCAACALVFVKDREHMVLGTERQFNNLNQSPSLQGKGQFVPAIKTEADPDNILRMAKDGASCEEIAEEIHPSPERN